MTVQTIKRMLDACYQAKRIREMLPALPLRRDTLLYSFSGCDPDHGEAGVAVKISDISDYLNIPTSRRDTDSKRNGRKGVSAESQCGGRR